MRAFCSCAVFFLGLFVCDSTRHVSRDVSRAPGAMAFLATRELTSNYYTFVHVSPYSWPAAVDDGNALSSSSLAR